MFKSFIKAARLRTLPLSISGIIVGASLAKFSSFYAESSDENGFYQMDYLIFILAIFTTIGFQVLSNFANDYGDGVKGTDNNDRVGPERALQSGAISPKQMLTAIIITAILTLIIALALIYVSFGQDNFIYSVTFFLLGIASVAAAIKYTMGKNAYGYSGLGDVFVFLFFGLLSVCGTYFLYTKHLNLQAFLPAFSVGMLSAAVLNLNNMRDIENDKAFNKNTLVVKMGLDKSKKYHYFLIIGSLICALAYSFNGNIQATEFIFLIAYIPLFIHLKKVMKTTNSKDFDPELKKVALSTFLFAILFGIGQVLKLTIF